MQNTNFNLNNIALASWLVLPILFVWISTNYLIGINRHTFWEVNSNPKENQTVTIPINSQPKEISSLEWQHTGLITLWFDDAWASQYSIAYPLLQEKGFSAALAVPTQLINFDDYMSWSQIKLLNYKGWEIDSHTRHHECDTKKLTDEFIVDELKGAQEDLLAEGIKSDNFVSPCGIVSTKLDTSVKEYYLSNRTSFPGLNPLPIENPYGLKVKAVRWSTTPQEVNQWIEDARNSKSWLILMFHQIQNKQEEYATTPDNFREIINIVANSKLPVVLPSQVLNMVDSQEDQNIEESTTSAKIKSDIPTKVNARNLPSTKGKIIAKVNPGQSYPLLEKKDDWYLLEIESEATSSAWVFKQYIEQ
jgi:hypothetical protein